MQDLHSEIINYNAKIMKMILLEEISNHIKEISSKDNKEACDNVKSHEADFLKLENNIISINDKTVCAYTDSGNKGSIAGEFAQEDRFYEKCNSFNAKETIE